MFETLKALPLAFWGMAFVLAYGLFWALLWIPRGLGVPMLAVLLTIMFWYPGDAFYNGYAHNHKETFPSDVLDAAWYQTAWFLITYLLLVQPVNAWVNRRYLNRTSRIGSFYLQGTGSTALQGQLSVLFTVCLIVWALLALIAVFRLRGESLYYFFPYLAYKADPWGRAQIGGGISALLSLAGYLQLFVAACFGIVLAMSRRSNLQFYALVVCGLAWPYYLLDRTRNTMVAVALPAILVWVFFRLRVHLVWRLAILAGFFLVVDGWFHFVVDNRTETTIVQAVLDKETRTQGEDDAKHLGLNMYEELCWINYFIQNGAYQVNWGQRYFAELVNPVPRGLWPGKPTIGLDYAVARGQVYGDEGVTATVATGMIGQGVVNFGAWLGPAAAALLMALWTAILVRCDLRSDETGQLPLYMLGLVLTFNLGRDITLLSLYSFMFGMVVVWLAGKYSNVRRPVSNTSSRRSPKPVPGNKRVPSLPPD